MLNITCTNAQKKVVTARPVTGSTPPRPATVDGPIRVSVVSGDGTIELDPAAPLGFIAVSGEETVDPTVPESGKTVYLVEADADLGEGVRTISDHVVLTVTSEEAQAFGLVEGATLPK